MMGSFQAYLKGVGIASAICLGVVAVLVAEFTALTWLMERIGFWPTVAIGLGLIIFSTGFAFAVQK